MNRSVFLFFFKLMAINFDMPYIMGEQEELQERTRVINTGSVFINH